MPRRGHPELAKALEQAGYVVLRFDFRGCGQSEGRRGDVIVDEEIADLRHAIDFLATQPGVDAARIGVIGASLGGSVAIEVAASDARVKVCVANGSIGNGERRYRAQYRDDAAWQAFLKRLDGEAQQHDAQPFRIVHIPERDRAGLPPGAIMEFTAATAQSLLDSCPERVVGSSRRGRCCWFIRAATASCRTARAKPRRRRGRQCRLHIIEGSAHFGSGSAEIARLVLDFLSGICQFKSALFPLSRFPAKGIQGYRTSPALGPRFRRGRRIRKYRGL